jgi:hypothetical protein
MHGLEKSVREPENTTLKAPASKNLCNVRVKLSVRAYQRPGHAVYKCEASHITTFMGNTIMCYTKSVLQRRFKIKTIIIRYLR